MAEHWRIPITIIIVVLLASAVTTYVHRRASWAFSLSRAQRIALGVLFIVSLVATTLSRSLGAEHGALAEPLGVYGGGVVLGILISSVLLLVVAVARLPLRLYRRIVHARTPASSRADTEPRASHAPARTSTTSDDVSDAPPLPDRRAFLARAAAGGAVTLGIGSGVYGALIGRHDYTLETVPIRLAKLPKALDGLTIVQLSDLHVGTFVGDYELRTALEFVQRAKPDVIVLTGDLIDHDPSYAAALARFTRTLQGQARYGVFAIPGNHDHYAGAAQVLRMLREAGTQVLLNRHVRIGDAGGQIVLAGIDDVAGPRFGSPGPRLEEAFANVSDEHARVLLSHNPSYFPRSHGWSDLTLSGHTHGGQIALFINPAELVLRHGFVRGHYAFEGSQLYVNRGFGTAGPPVRVGSPPEITKLVLTSG
jgi:uncharacterized protein